MPIPNVYRRSGEGLIASYAYTDVAEGTGVVLFYGTTSYQGGAYAYYLSNNAMYSDLIESTAACTIVTDTKLIDNDFDVTFNMPQNIKGKVRVNLTLGQVIGAGTGNSNAYVVLRVRKWDGVTETEIASATSGTKSYAYTTGAVVSDVLNMEVNVSSVQHFKKGETFRLTVEIWDSMSGTADSSVGYAHDPMDRDTAIVEASDTTVLKCYVPFILDL